MNVYVKGLNSCGMRRVDVQAYQDYLVANGHVLVSRPEQAQKVLLWTCGFRTDSRENSLGQVKHYTQQCSAEVVVAGCLPLIDRLAFGPQHQPNIIHWGYEEADFARIFGPATVPFDSIPRAVVEHQWCEDVERFRTEHPEKDASFVDQFIKLFCARGCRFQCAYCSERLAFPPYRSTPLDALVAGCKRMVDDTGVKRVMLLGDSIGDYGHDIGTDLPTLIRALKQCDPALRIGIQGFNPGHFLRFMGDMAAFIYDGTLIHLQLAIQTASDRLLWRMRRPYTRPDIDFIFELLNRLGFTAFDTHLIFGFPGETDQDVGDTITFLCRHRPRYVLLSLYMESEHMPSAALPNKIPATVAVARMHRAERALQELGIICNAEGNALSCHRFHTIKSTL